MHMGLRDLQASLLRIGVVVIVEFLVEDAVSGADVILSAAVHLISPFTSDLHVVRILAYGPARPAAHTPAGRFSRRGRARSAGVRALCRLPYLVRTVRTTVALEPAALLACICSRYEVLRFSPRNVSLSPFVLKLWPCLYSRPA